MAASATLITTLPVLPVVLESAVTQLLEMDGQFQGLHTKTSIQLGFRSRRDLSSSRPLKVSKMIWNPASPAGRLDANDSNMEVENGG